jgi:hypothetical protein
VGLFSLFPLAGQGQTSSRSAAQTTPPSGTPKEEKVREMPLQRQYYSDVLESLAKLSATWRQQGETLNVRALRNAQAAVLEQLEKLEGKEAKQDAPGAAKDRPKLGIYKPAGPPKGQRSPSPSLEGVSEKWIRRQARAAQEELTSLRRWLEEAEKAPAGGPDRAIFSRHLTELRHLLRAMSHPPESATTPGQP